MEVDLQQLNRELDKAKTKVFMSTFAAFFGSLMCSLNFHWDDSIPTAATDAVSLFWNSEFFQKLNKCRGTVIMHELWHVARLHHLRQGARDHRLWNIACDFRINNDLSREGWDFSELPGVCLDHAFDINGIMPEEDIYDLLAQNPPPPQLQAGWGDGKGDMMPQLDPSQNQHTINTVVRAAQQAKLSGGSGKIPGNVEEIIKEFLEPQIPWQVVLMQFFTDLLHDDYTWRRPNRRYTEMYLPTRFTDDGRLEHLVYYLDVSGSISDHDILVFNSEVKYIQETLKPQKLTLVQFDTQITDVREFEEEDPFVEIKVVGRGGTCLVPVWEHIERIKPTCAVIFTDLQVAPMQPLPYAIPVIWATTSKHPNVLFGKVIHIK